MDNRHPSSFGIGPRLLQRRAEGENMQLSKEELRRLGHLAVDMAANYLAELPDRLVFQRWRRGNDKLANMPIPSVPLSGDEILRLMAEQITAPYGNGHPRRLGEFPAMTLTVTEMLAAAMNPSCAGGNHAAVYLEHCAVRWLMELLDFPVEGSAGCW